MSLAILFYFLCTQRVSDINISIIRSLRLCCWITTLVVLFLFRCVLEIWCGWVSVVSVLQASDVNISIIRSLRLCCWITTLVVLFLFLCELEIWCSWVSVVSVLQAASACNTSTTQNQPHQISNAQGNENKTTDVVIQQHSRKLLMMDMLMSEICWVHKKWDKIASDIKLLFYSSAITVMHGPINIRNYIVICKVLLNIFIFIKASFSLVLCEKSLLGTTGLIALVLRFCFKKRLLVCQLACLTPILKVEDRQKSVISVTDCTVCDADNAILCTN